MRSLKMVDNLRYMVAMELMHGAQATDMRGDVALGRVTGPVKAAFRQVIPYLSEDRNLSRDIADAYACIKDGRLLQALEEADA